MATTYIKIATFYFVVAILLGITMGATHNFALASVHAHINLLGWVSTALFGLIYHFYPAAGESTLAKIHFWLHNIGALLFFIGLYFAVTAEAPLLAVIGSNIVGLGVIIFGINVFKNVRATNKVAN